MPSPVEGAVRGATTTVKIAAGASITDAIDCGETRLAAIQLPAAWTAANLTFQVSYDLGTTYADLYDATGTEYTVTAAASRSILVPWADFMNARYLKIRSGTAASPVNQVAARTLSLGLAA